MSHRPRLLAAALATLSAAACVAPVRYAERSAEAEAQARRAADAEARLAQAQEALARARADLDGTLAKVAAFEAALAEDRARVEQARTEERARLARELEAARAALGKQIAAGEVEVREAQDRVIFGMAERVLFPSGSATLSRSGHAALADVAAALQALLEKAEAAGVRRLVRVEGHSDDQPIATARFPSNWDLSSARAASVVRYLEGHGIPGARLFVAGFGPHWPVTPNAGPEARARNRRIEVVLVPEGEHPLVSDLPAPLPVAR